MGGLNFKALGIVVDDLIVLLNGILIISLLVGDFADVELCVGGEVCVAVVPEIILKFGAGELIFAAGNVAETVGIEGVRGGRRTRR